MLKCISFTQDPMINDLIGDLCSHTNVTLHRLDVSEHWPQTLAQYLDSNQNHIVFIEANTFDSNTLETLTPLLTSALKIDWVFFSAGLPNTLLDTFVIESAAFHFRTPFDEEKITSQVKDIFDMHLQENLSSHASKPQSLTSQLDQFGFLVGSSEVMLELYILIKKVASSTHNVMLLGESGVGKELVAQTIHQTSDRSNKPFVAINCGAISSELIESELFGHIKGAFTGATRNHDGVFSQAEGGVLFLDEVTEMPLDQQVKLLRVLENKEFRPLGSETMQTTNVRVISASNRNPVEAVRDGFLRQDLFYRLGHFPIDIPPLRKRTGDIFGLAQHFLAYLNDEHKTNKKFTKDIADFLEAHSWPGNVRELKHTIERGFLLATDDIISAHQLQLTEQHYEKQNTDDQSLDVPAGVPLEKIEKMAIEKSLDHNDGNKSLTAEQLGISVKTLYNKLDKYDG